MNDEQLQRHADNLAAARQAITDAGGISLLEAYQREEGCGEKYCEWWSLGHRVILLAGQRPVKPGDRWSPTFDVFQPVCLDNDMPKLLAAIAAIGSAPKRPTVRVALGVDHQNSETKLYSPDADLDIEVFELSSPDPDNTDAAQWKLNTEFRDDVQTFQI